MLTDYDLSSWTASLKTDCTKTSYMTQELLMGRSDIHRHDIESPFYVMLLTCARHKFDRSNRRNGRCWVPSRSLFSPHITRSLTYPLLSKTFVHGSTPSVIPSQKGSGQDFQPKQKGGAARVVVKTGWRVFRSSHAPSCSVRR